MTKEEKLVVIDSLAEQLQAYPHFYIADIVALLQSPAKNVISALQANAGQKIAGLVKTLESRNN